jgi:tetratricopeptide (TPR) repeat protein/transcriptional regulator with XRE-family HTH domain
MRFGERLRQLRRTRHLSQADLAEALAVSVQSVSRWERNEVIPQAHFRLQMSRFFAIPPTELWESGEDREAEQRAPEVIWSVPYPRNPFFTGREDLLHTLHEQLNREHTMALTQSLAVSGLGGIGKTQIALEYAYHYCQNYQFVFWLSAASRETLIAGLMTITELLQLPEKHEHDQNRVLQAIKLWLTTHQQWLFILDNADDPTVIHGILPSTRSGHVLLTTRAQSLGALARRIEVETMGMAEATLFLLRRARLLAHDASLDQTAREHLATAEAIAIEMDFLPLALDQAGAYIEEIGCSLLAYLDLYRIHRKELLQRRGDTLDGHPEPVATTWSLSFQKVEQANPVAAELLRFCAFLEPDAIPEELISAGSAHLGMVLGPGAQDILRLNEAIQQLRKFSLLQRDPGSRLLRAHRLVQAVLKDAMEKEEQRRWAERAVLVTSSVFPQTVEMMTWPLCRRYLSQAQVCTELIQIYTFACTEAASLLHRTACYLYNYALYEQAEPLLRQAIQIKEQVLGPAHPDVALSLTRLADLNIDQGKHEQAESLLHRAMGIQEQSLGPEHPDVASSLTKLAHLYRMQGKYERAERLFLRAVCIGEQALGPEHPDLAYTLTRFAVLYAVQGKYMQAEPLLRRAIQIQEETPGHKDLELAYSLNGLANISYEQGRYEDAECLYTRALHIWEQALGPDYPDVARVSHNLALLHYEQEKYMQAEPLFQRAIRIWEQTLGPDHPNLSYPLNGLGDLYRAQGKPEQSELFYLRALQITEQAMGPEHPEVTYSLHGLGILYMQQGKYEQAEQLLGRTLCLQERHLDPLHADRAEILHDLAMLRELQGTLQEAASLYQRALSIREQIFGPDHARTTDTRQRLHAVLHKLDRAEEMKKKRV